MTSDLLAAWPRVGPAHEATVPSVLKTTICEETTRVCVEQDGDRLGALVLTGSMARDEATFVEEGSSWKLLGDGEFVLVFRSDSAVAPASRLTLLARKIEDRLLRRRIRCHISLIGVHPSYLQKLPPHIFGYELRACGQIVWGEPDVLSLIPHFAASEIPLEDGWRLLCNRMIEQLEIAEELAQRRDTLSANALYRTVKLYLDMGTSFLLFVGAYEPTYRKRAEKLRVLGANAYSQDGDPFPLPVFAERVAACTHWKLAGVGTAGLAANLSAGGAALGFWEEAVTYARLLWRWQLARLTGAQGQVSSRELQERWMRFQPTARCLRGWLYVLRKQGWHRSWRQWPRWGQRSWRASPRYWIYAAASQLFFHLPCLLRCSARRQEADVDWKELRSWLPVIRESEESNGLPDWRRLAADIAWNYQQFLTGTRA